MARTLHKVNVRQAVRNILFYFDQATPGDIATGAEWYGLANREARDLSEITGLPVDVTATVLSHLSPQTRWEDNKRHAWDLLTDESGTAKPAGAMGANVARARGAVVAFYAGRDPLSTFGPRAHKTRRFASAIIDGGAGQSVVIDVWAARAALQGAEYRFRDSEATDENAQILKRVGVYAQIERAYVLAARARGVSPSTMQAVVWGIIRGSFH